MILLFLIWSLLMIEAVKIIGLGGFADRQKLDEFLSENLGGYELNEFSSQKSLWQASKPYIAYFPTFLSRWNIQGMGVVPRWSRWDTLINIKRNQLIKEIC